MRDLTDILQCPATRAPLRWLADDRLIAGDGRSYVYKNGVARFLTPHGGESRVREFYENEGWSEDDEGHFGDTNAFVDTRETTFNFTRKCMARLGKYFRKGGEYLLDAGSGPIPHAEVLAYGNRFENRVCVDLSVHGLQAARAKLGEKGVYLQGDLTNLPIKDGAMDAVTCNHVIYQIPPEAQAAAFLELWRVLKPGGVAVVVYWWPQSPLAWRIEKLTKLVVGDHSSPVDEPAQAAPANAPSHNPLPLSWFESQNWPFRYEIDCFRVVSNDFMKRYVSDDWRGRVFLEALYALQIMAPGFCGRRGVMPAIIIHKD
jgi:SAM-dependent methyltransferase